MRLKPLIHLSVGAILREPCPGRVSERRSRPPQQKKPAGAHLSTGVEQSNGKPIQPPYFPSNAALSVAMSNFTIFSIASDARFAFVRSGSAIILNITVGTICHETP